MLRRLEAEDARLKKLALSGELSPEGEKIALDLLKKSRGELLTELQNLEANGA